MPTQGANGVGAATKSIADHAIALARLELRLAALELKKKGAAFAAGVGMLVGAAIFALYALGFLLSAAASGIATALPMWASLLIVGGALVLLSTLLVLLGKRSLEHAVPPIPEQAIDEAKATREAVKPNGSRRTPH